jgi:hypothetical protein
MTELFRVAISQHAVDQYRARFAARLTEAEARDQLDDLLRRAHVVRSYPDGDQLLRSPKPLSVRMVIGHRGGVPTLVTVKPPYQGPVPEHDLASYPDTLPGGLLPLALDPCPAGGVALADTRAVHALLTGAFGQDHNTLVPTFALLLTPTPSGWSVLHRDRALALQWQGRSWRGHWFGRGEVRATFGACSVPYTPEFSAPGLYRVRLLAHTPVCVRNSVQDKTTYPHPTGPSLVGALTGGLRERLSLRRQGVEGCVRLRMVEHHTETVRQRSSRFSDEPGGFLAGWRGRVVVETDALGLWLLRCAERIGLGGRVSLGFGRVELEEVSCLRLERPDAR